MICTKLLSPIEKINDFSILAIVDIGDFVIYKRISNKKFYNSISIANYLEIDSKNLENIYIEEGEYFLVSYKLFKEEFDENDELIKKLKSDSNFENLKLLELKNFINIINKEGNDGSLITFNKNIDGTFEPYYVFVDPYKAEKELNYLLETPFIKGNLGAIANLYENMIINLKKANYNFLDKNSQIHFFVHNIILLNVEKVIFDIEHSN